MQAISLEERQAIESKRFTLLTWFISFAFFGMPALFTLLQKWPF